jgi:hypothetical protein
MSAGSAAFIVMMVATAAALKAIAFPPKRHNSLDSDHYRSLVIVAIEQVFTSPNQLR